MIIIRIAVMFCTLIVPIYPASFFDEFRGAVSSVEDSFGKLVSDVVTDVSETIGCTILAVKQVLSLNPVFHETSDYDKRCRGSTDQSTVTEVNTSFSPQIKIGNVNERYLSDGLSQQIKESIVQANETGFNLIERHDAHKKIETMEGILQNEKNRLLEISNLFKRGFDHMPHEIRIKFHNKHSTSDEPTIESIWRDLKILREIEHNNKNSQEAKEVRHVLDEALDILNLNKPDVNTSDDDKIKNIVSDLESESNRTLNNVENQFQQWKKDEHIENVDIEDVTKNEEENNVPHVFKDFDYKLTHDKNKQELEESSESSKDKIDINDFFKLFGQDSKSKKEAAEDATRFVESTKHTDTVLNEYFKKNKDVGVSVFDNPELFNFD
ncbi:uncharacterized protein LOC131841767 [Achroia grisella]|uniref:uncharacterized protein LOC131841767 n=1 Tax=Achroia grisella TaxID=688607 RepID=UPI0027D24C1C|nr:uncharacterized protein LOC131841767 [Achroia grisella]